MPVLVLKPETSKKSMEQTIPRHLIIFLFFIATAMLTIWDFPVPHSAIADHNDVVPRILINNSDDLIVARSQDPVTVTLSLTPGDYTGQLADWWIYAETPAGMFSWVYPGGWSAGQASFQYPLIELPPFNIWDRRLPEGKYSLYFGVDENSDGNMDMTWKHTAQVSVCPESSNYSRFESGNIGGITPITSLHRELRMRDDNDNCTLPLKWRTWWYARLHLLPLNAPMTIDLTGRGWPYFYVPVYSYDNIHWLRLDENEVSLPATDELQIEKHFNRRRVWLARFYPYTFTHLIDYLTGIMEREQVCIESIGLTESGLSIPMLTITDFSVTNHDKKRIWIHARTHPAETGGSFLLEGLINFLLSGNDEANLALTGLIFNIVPMHNIDGVIVGNYRTTPDSTNLETEWHRDQENPKLLTSDASAEVRALHKTILRLVQEGPEVSIALNLHSSNSEPDIRPFFYPHFGPEALGYLPNEATLWNKQINFITQVGRFYGPEMLEPLRDEGGSSFVAKSYPESWWWANFQEMVMAITLETTYGRAGYAPHWIIPDNLMNFGAAVTQAIMAYHGLETDAMKAVGPLTEEMVRKRSVAIPLKYPELYPPLDPNEGKE